MFIRAFSLLETQRSRARKSAIVDAVVFAVAAAGNGLEQEPYWTTSAQEGELDTIAVFF
jgi:hypothetical protein